VGFSRLPNCYFFFDKFGILFSGVVSMKTKAVRLHGVNDLRLDEFDLPEIKDDEILVKNTFWRTRRKYET